jgi:hypothetical protein
LQIAADDGVTEGPICALTAVELCSSYAIKRNPSTQQPELQITPRKCLFVYQYWMHPVVGFMSARLQTWFPFPIHVYMNGRAWLAQRIAPESSIAVTPTASPGLRISLGHRI